MAAGVLSTDIRSRMEVAKESGSGALAVGAAKGNGCVVSGATPPVRGPAVDARPAPPDVGNGDDPEPPVWRVISAASASASSRRPTGVDSDGRVGP
jgi:hypothetical protein